MGAVSAVTRVQLSTRDGVTLSALHWDAGVRDAGCVVAHGFTGAAGKGYVRTICAALCDRGFGVLAPDMRGHGRSGGRCTAGASERYDVAAAVEWMRAHRYGRVAVLGWSMGGTAVLRYAGLLGEDEDDGGTSAGPDAGASTGPDAVVAVSAPSRWFERSTRPMRIAHWMCESRTGRIVARLTRRTRIAASGWDENDVPKPPAEVAGAIAPTPLLLVHGEADHYFPGAHIDALADAAPGAQVWREAGMGHAETATTPELLSRIADWVTGVIAVAQRDRA
jgi:pimeloyl-ACP methyl ester carboxylesterase